MEQRIKENGTDEVDLPVSIDPKRVSPILQLISCAPEREARASTLRI